MFGKNWLLAFSIISACQKNLASSHEVLFENWYCSLAPYSVMAAEAV
jgi:hypothetical protein